MQDQQSNQSQQHKTIVMPDPRQDTSVVLTAEQKKTIEDLYNNFVLPDITSSTRARTMLMYVNTCDSNCA
ncbi:MAG: hypothetical protein ACM3SY_00595 [Candidatus Omnitrophota bacterium]